MTSQPDTDANGNAKRGAKRKAGGKASSREKPLKPWWAASTIEAMATVTAVAEFIASLAGGDPRDPSNMFAELTWDIDRTRERCNDAYSESLLSSMPSHLAFKEIERLRSYEARMLANKRKAMKALLTSAASAWAKRSQEASEGPNSEGSAKKVRARRVRTGKTNPNALRAMRCWAKQAER